MAMPLMGMGGMQIDNCFVEADDFCFAGGMPAGIFVDGQGGKLSHGFGKESNFDQGPIQWSLPGKSDLNNEQKSVRFSPAYLPPKVPQNGYYTLAPTTFRMVPPTKNAPHSIGNTFLSFLETMEKADVIKVRPEKYWVSANVFLDNQMCNLKARVYYGDGEAFPLELQRRSGCVVTFAKLYNKVVEFFRMQKYHILAEEGGEDAPSPMLPPAFPDLLDVGTGFLPIPPLIGSLPESSEVIRETKQEDLRPLFDMMLFTDTPSLQAEALNSLSDIACDKPNLLNKDTFVNNVQHLLTGCFPDDPEAEYAFAHLLSKAMTDVETSQSLAKAGTLSLLVDKVCSKAGSTLIKKELAQVVAEGAKNLSCSLSTERDRLMKELEAALPPKDFDIMDLSVQEQLQKTRKWLTGCPL